MKKFFAGVYYKLRCCVLKRWVKKKFKRYSFTQAQIDCIVFGMYIAENKKKIDKINI